MKKYCVECNKTISMKVSNKYSGFCKKCYNELENDTNKWFSPLLRFFGREKFN